MKTLSTMLILGLFLTSSLSFGAQIHDDIYRQAQTVQSEIYQSRANLSQLSSASNYLANAINLVRGNGSGGGNTYIYCQQIQGSRSYVPARVNDRVWLQEYATDLGQCQSQINGARYDLFCSRVGTTSYYAPKTISSISWRGQYGSDYNSCDLQVRFSQPTVFCQRVQSTQYYAPARVYDGSWLSSNGTLLNDCLRSIGSIRTNAKTYAAEPSVPSDNKIN